MPQQHFSKQAVFLSLFLLGLLIVPLFGAAVEYSLEPAPSPVPSVADPDEELSEPPSAVTQMVILGLILFVLFLGIIVVAQIIQLQHFL